MATHPALPPQTLYYLPLSDSLLANSPLGSNHIEPSVTFWASRRSTSPSQSLRNAIKASQLVNNKNTHRIAYSPIRVRICAIKYVKHFLDSKSTTVLNKELIKKSRINESTEEQKLLHNGLESIGPRILIMYQI